MEQHHGNAHVGGCLSRYRSYKPNTDTFLGYDGRHNPCNSPF
ncbi:MAG: BA14K family protein [Rhizobiales bacterium]|nr:BA14K family protein [Hyphomicrobiales bacterium]